MKKAVDKPRHAIYKTTIATAVLKENATWFEFKPELL